MLFKPLRAFSILFLFVFFFLWVSVAIQDEHSFYENSDYKNYLTSMIQDHDFNMINQPGAEQSWLVTQSRFHPSFHTEAMTPFFLLAYGVEKAVTALVPAKSSTLHFHLGFAVLNLILTLVGSFFLLQTLRSFNFKATWIDLIFFLTSTAFVFFDIWTATVIEIEAFFFTSVLLYLATSDKSKLQNMTSWFLVGVFIGFSALVKTFQWLWLLPFLVRAFRHSKKAVAILLLPACLLLVADLLNRQLKFGQWAHPLFEVVPILITYDPLNALKSLWFGYFSWQGLFSINISYFIGVIGLLGLWRHQSSIKPKSLLQQIDVGTLFAAFFLYLIPPLFLLGQIVEDHFPGRVLINLIPFLFIGYCWFMSTWHLKIRRPLQIFLLILHWLYLVSYFWIDQEDSYQYPKSFWRPPIEVIGKTSHWLGAQVESLLFQPGAVLSVVLMSFLTTLLLFFLWRRKVLLAASLSVMLFCFGLYLLMTAANWRNAPEKVLRLEQQGFFQGKSIGTGPEAYAADYVLDAANTFMQTSADNQVLLRQRLSAYFRKLSDQVQTRDPEIQRKILNQDLSLSFWVQMNELRKSTAPISRP